MQQSDTNTPRIQTRRRTQRVLSDHNLRVLEIDLDAQGGRHDVDYPGVPLLLIDGELEGAPSWWMLDMVRWRVPHDTIETYAKGIELWFSALHQNGVPWHDATIRTAQGFIGALVRRGNRENTVVTRMAAVLSFYKWAKTQGLLSALPFTKSDLRVPKGRTRSVDTHSKSQFEAIVAKLPRIEHGMRRRDELICECGRFLGLRRKEVTGLKAADFRALDPEIALNVVWTDPSYTKQGKSRAVLIPRLLVRKMQNFIDVYRQEIVQRRTGDEPGWTPPPNLFLTERGTPVTGAYITDTNCFKF